MLTGTLFLKTDLLVTENLLNRTLVKIIALIAIICGNGLIRTLVNGCRLWGTLPARSGTSHHTNLAGDS